MEMFSKFISILRVQTLIVVRLSIHLLLTVKTRRNILFSTCSTDGEKMKRHGPIKETQI
ncbi:hypothetical protein SDC9_104576 [bioreactor metagenome]|uniref:Uncharacterized protein n=1 Tax=bioreactor metagenome TaxID=1076179 RepID=A0A645B3M4_9ZZZZ